MTNTAERKMERDYVWVMVQSKVTGRWRKRSKHNTYDEAVAEMVKLILMFPTATFRILKADGTHIY